MSSDKSPNVEKSSPTTKNDSAELRAMQFRTQLPLGSGSTTRIATDDLHRMLANESRNAGGVSWGKLNKTAKSEKLREWVERVKEERSLSDDAVAGLEDILTRHLDNGRLSRTRDVVYSVEDGRVESIPRLEFCETRKRYTLRRASAARPKPGKSARNPST